MEGKALRESRKKLGYTQDGLAKKLGVSANTVARWERDEMAIPPYLELALKQIESKSKK
jgi:transcriptional regulator with XRE-family HTH domain